MNVDAAELARIFRAAADGANPPAGHWDTKSYDQQKMMSRVFEAIASIYEKMAADEPSP